MRSAAGKLAWWCIVVALALMGLLAMPFCNLSFAVVLGPWGISSCCWRG